MNLCCSLFYLCEMKPHFVVYLDFNFLNFLLLSVDFPCGFASLLDDASFFDSSSFFSDALFVALPAALLLASSFSSSSFVDSSSSNFSTVASNLVLRSASLVHAAGSRLYNSDISGTNPSSGLGSAMSDRILNNKLGRETAGLHDPDGGDFNVSKQIRP